MTVIECVSALVTGGEIRLPPPNGASDRGDAKALRAFLIEVDQRLRLEAPGSAPTLHEEAAIWAATAIYHASQLTIYRDAGGEVVQRLLDVEPPAMDTASAHWSVDLVMRFLPDLHRLASGLSKGDPLVDRLTGWATAWPLSSVGIALETGETGIETTTVPEAIRSDQCLRLIYTDRVVARRDWTRLRDPVVLEDLRAAFGGFDPWPVEVVTAMDKAQKECPTDG